MTPKVLGLIGSAPAYRPSASDGRVHKGEPAPAVLVTAIAPSDRQGVPPRVRGERIVVVLGGFGKLLIDGDVHRFRGPCTLLLPLGADCTLVNLGVQPLRAVFVYSRPEAV